MSEITDSKPWWEKRLNNFESEGFHTEKIRVKINIYEDQRTAIIEQYENLVSRSLNLKEKLKLLPNYLNSEKEDLLSRVKNAEDIHVNEEEYFRLLSVYFPWRIAAKQNKVN